MLNEIHVLPALCRETAEVIERLQLLIASPGGGGGAGRIQQQLQGEDVLHIWYRDWPHLVPLPRQHGHEVFLFQAKQRIADRGPADVEALCQYLLPEFLPWAVLASQNCLPYR